MYNIIVDRYEEINNDIKIYIKVSSGIEQNLQ